MDIKNFITHCRPGAFFWTVYIFLFALSPVDNPFTIKTVATFVITFFCLYPSTSLYNNYFDKDEGPVMMMEKPAPITDALWYGSHILDAIGFVLAHSYGGGFQYTVVIFAVTQRLYSHPSVRLKARPYASFLIWNFVEGYVTTIGIYNACNSSVDTWNPQAHAVALITTTALLGNWPLTQVYQHAEDACNGDVTLSMMLGVKASLQFAYGVLGLAGLMHFACFYAWIDNPLLVSGVFVVCFFPVAVALRRWKMKVEKDEEEANFANAMSCGNTGATSATFFYTWLLIYQKVIL